MDLATLLQNVGRQAQTAMQPEDPWSRLNRTGIAMLDATGRPGAPTVSRSLAAGDAQRQRTLSRAVQSLIGLQGVQNTRDRMDQQRDLTLSGRDFTAEQNRLQREAAERRTRMQIDAARTKSGVAAKKEADKILQGKEKDARNFMRKQLHGVTKSYAEGIGKWRETADGGLSINLTISDRANIRLAQKYMKDNRQAVVDGKITKEDALEWARVKRTEIIQAAANDFKNGVYTMKQIRQRLKGLLGGLTPKELELIRLSAIPRSLR